MPLSFALPMDPKDPVATSVQAALVASLLSNEDTLILTSSGSGPDEAYATKLLPHLQGALTKDSPEVLVLAADSEQARAATVRAESHREADIATALRRLPTLAQSSFSSPLAEGDSEFAPLARSIIDGAPDVVRRRDQLIALRDQAARSTDRVAMPLVAVIAHTISTWSAIDALVRELHEREDCEVVVVTVESHQEVLETTTAEYIAGLGYRVEDVDWLTAELEDVTSRMSLMLFYDPWDDFRPAAARVLAGINTGIRTAYVPYAVSTVEDAGMHAFYSYFQPAILYSWRMYVRSETAIEDYRHRLVTGVDHVRAMGMPKTDRIVHQASVGSAAIDHPWEPQTKGRMTVLWNPHFSLGEYARSTMAMHVQPLVDYAREHSDVFLLVRPHFRIPMEAAAGVASHRRSMEILTNACDELDNVAIDNSPDFLEAFAASDLMISDQSTLITEYLPTGKPVILLEGDHLLTVNADSLYFHECALARSPESLLAQLESHRRGEDLTKDHRAATMERWFPLVDGQASRRIADDLLTSFRQEITG